MKKSPFFCVIFTISIAALGQQKDTIFKNNFLNRNAYLFKDTSISIGKENVRDFNKYKTFWDSIDAEDKASTITGHLIPYNEFDKIIDSSVNKYILFNTTVNNTPAITLDIVDENFNLSYMHRLKRPATKKRTYIGFDLSAGYSTSSAEATIYSSGGFVNNVLFTPKINFFLNGSGPWGPKDEKQSIRKAIFFKLDSIENQFNTDSSTLTDLFGKKFTINDTCRPKCIEESLSQLYQFETGAYLYGKDQKSLMAILQAKRDGTKNAVYANPAIFFKKKIKWLSLSLPSGSPSYKIYDPAKTIGSRLGSMRVVKAGINFFYNYLEINQGEKTLWYWSVGGGFIHQANLADIKSNDFTEQTDIVTTAQGNSYIEKKATAYYKDDLKGKGYFNLKGDMIYMFSNKAHLGFNETMEFNMPAIINAGGKTIIGNTFGFLFPVKNKKDDPVTIVKVYWRCTGQSDTKFNNDFGFKVGLPININ